MILKRECGRTWQIETVLLESGTPHTVCVCVRVFVSEEILNYLYSCFQALTFVPGGPVLSWEVLRGIQKQYLLSILMHDEFSAVNILTKTSKSRKAAFLEGSFILFGFVAQILEEDKEHGPLVTVCHVFQEEIPLDPAGRARR